MKQLVLDGMDELPTTTAHQSRLQIYAPTRKPKFETRIIETPWGTAKIIGKIGQGHADVMEAIFSQASKWREFDDGTMQILVDPHRVRVAASSGNYKLSYERLNDITTDLMQTVIDMSVPGRDYNMDKGTLITRIQDSIIDVPEHSKTRSSSFGKNRKMWRVDLGEAFVRLLNKDISLYYDPKPIAKLNSGVSQAVARNLLSHTVAPSAGWLIDNVIKAVGAGGDSKKMWERRNEIIEDADGLKLSGLVVEGGRIKRKK